MVQCAVLIAPYVFRQSDGGGGVERHTPSPRQQKGRSAPRILYNAPLLNRRMQVRRVLMAGYAIR